MFVGLIDKAIMDIITEADVSVGLILGGRRKGKSVLGYGIIDNLCNINNLPAFVFGLPTCKHTLLPEFIKPISNLDLIPDGSAFIVDEAYREFYSRMSMSHRNKFIDTLVALSGQKQLKSVYITQHARRVERGIVGDVDFILFKKPSLMQMEFDRPEFKRLLFKVHKAFQDLKPPNGLSLNEYQKQCTYIVSEDFVGMIENSNKPPSWWSEDISRAYAGVPLDEQIEEAKYTEKQILSMISSYIGGKKTERSEPYIPKSKRTVS